MSSVPSYYQIHSEGIICLIQVQPGAKKSECWGLTPEGYLKIRLKAPALEGKANQALIEFLAERLQVRKKDLEIISGEFARKKRILLKTTNHEQILNQLNKLLKVPQK